MKQATRAIRPVELEMLAAPIKIGLVFPAPQRNKVIKESLTSLWVCLLLSAMVPVYSCMLIQQDLHLVVSTGWRSLCPSCPGAVKSLIQAEIGVARKLPLAASQHLHCPAGSGGFHSAQPPAQRPLRRAWAPVPASSPPPALIQPPPIVSVDWGLPNSDRGINQILGAMSSFEVRRKKKVAKLWQETDHSISILIGLCDAIYGKEVFIARL